MWNVTYAQVGEDCRTAESRTGGAQSPSNENALTVRHVAISHLETGLESVIRGRQYELSAADQVEIYTDNMDNPDQLICQPSKLMMSP